MPPTPSAPTGGSLRRGARIIATGFRRQPRWLAIAVIGSALYGVMTVYTARVIGHLTATVVTPAVNARRVTDDQLWTIAWELSIVVALNVIGVILRRVAAGLAFFNLNATYRREVTRQYLRLPLAWHHRHPSGQLLSNANADVEAAWNIFQPLPMALGVLVMLVVGLWEMFTTDLWLALVGVLVFPLLFAVNLVFQSRMAPRATRAQELRAVVSEVAHESIEAGMLVKAMGREERETERFAARTNELRAAAIEVGRVRGTFDPIVEAIPTIGTLAVLAVGTAQVAAGRITAAQVVQIAYLFSVLAFPVRSFGWVLGQLPQSLVGFDRLQRVLTARGEFGYGNRSLPTAGPAHAVAERVTFSYALTGQDSLGYAEAETPSEHFLAVDDVSLDLTPGSTTALVGPTGAGKSTLTDLMVRLVDPDAGEVSIDGTALPQVRRGGIPQSVALVPQQTFLFDDTVEGNVTLGEPHGAEQVRDALAVAQATGFVDALPEGAQTRVGERGASLSGGQRQRIALARAVIRRPRLLVLDDATSAIDPAVETAILTGLRERSAGTTVLVVAYRMSTIALADSVIFLDRGRIADRGTHAELMQRCEGYRTLVTAYAREAAEREAIAADEEPGDQGAVGDSLAGEEEPAR
ncbi:ABC transporter ATP-binding protein [Metallococcus carri]|nr:ABC transporter ATP-binding protein [Metallococcus carri]